MTLRLENDWAWDSWPFDDGQGLHHLFFLKAPRSLGDPGLRHANARVGHAVSSDYRTWDVLPDVLGPSVGPAWDDGAIWTGSVVPGPSGSFHFFYTACSRAENYRVQRIGRADSTDLISWTRASDQPLLEVDPRWYEVWDGENWHDQAWRDPWVFADPNGDGWHMLITARSNHGAQFSRGVVGHAWSGDLDHWEVRPPLSEPGGFGQLEVLQYVPPGVIDSAPRLLFSCGAGELDFDMHPDGQPGGMWIATGAGMLGPWDIANAQRIDHPTLYAAHVITDIDGSPAVIGFDAKSGAAFDGCILDPIPL